MKACVATGEKRILECQDIPVPKAEPGWILLKTIYTCICGSDLEYLDGALALLSNEAASLATVVPGSVPGHEFVAEVVEVGDGVTGWAIGDRAVPRGNPDPRGIGPAQTSYENYRCMAEYFRSTPYGLMKVADHVRNEAAVLVEPLMTANGAVTRAGVRPGHSVVVIGAGKIGLLAVMAAKAAGASPVISMDVVPSRLEKALEIGADAVINASEVDSVHEAQKLTDGGPDAILICVRDGKVLNQATDMAKPGGIIVLAGFVAPMEVNPMIWTYKRLTIAGIMGGSIEDAMHMIRQGQIDPEPLITETVPFDDCQRAIDSVYSGENIAVLFSPDL